MSTISTENPFIEYNKQLETPKIPRFNKTTHIQGRLSEEAYEYLKALSLRFTGKDNPINLLELIGLCILHLEGEDSVAIDEDSGVTTEDCRQSGFEDAMRRDPKYFLALYGKAQTRFHEAYLRGYYEGSFIRDAK